MTKQGSDDGLRPEAMPTRVTAKGLGDILNSATPEQVAEGEKRAAAVRLRAANWRREGSVIWTNEKHIKDMENTFGYRTIRHRGSEIGLVLTQANTEYIRSVLLESFPTPQRKTYDQPVRQREKDSFDEHNHDGRPHGWEQPGRGR